MRLWQERATARLRGLNHTQWLLIGLLALLAIYGAVLTKHASYAVGGADSSGYASIARSLLRGEVIRPIRR